MRRRILVALGLCFGLIVAAGSSAGAYVFTGQRWASPTIYYRTSTMASAYGTSAGSARSSWTNSTDVNFAFAPGASYRLYTQNDGNSGYAGWSTWNYSGSTINSATSRLNTYVTDGYVTNKKQAVWAHELGHVIGLAHSSAGTIMYSCPGCTYDTYSGRRTPQSDDINGANARY